MAEINLVTSTILVRKGVGTPGEETIFEGYGAFIVPQVTIGSEMEFIDETGKKLAGVVQRYFLKIEVKKAGSQFIAYHVHEVDLN